MRPPALAVLLALSTAALAEPLPDQSALERAAAQLAPVDLQVDLSSLPINEQFVLGLLVEAAKIMDGLFLRQVWAGNQSRLLDLLGDDTPLGRARLRMFLINKGPWDRIDHNRPFLPGAPPKPPEANFYPAGATKADVAAWMKSLPDGERARAAGFYTTIRRGPDGKFTIVPYSIEYQGELARAAELLRKAAAATGSASLRKFLTLRAEAFAGNDYAPSDVAWMELDSAVEPTIGPYEVYEDEWFNAKAAFEAFIAVRDDAETAKLARFSSQLQDLENHLPIDPKLRNPKIGAAAPIRVVNEVFCAGDASHGVQTAAYNLPNDEEITKTKGTKRIMLKNVQEAKFAKVLQPIAAVALSAADRPRVAFDAFFTHILMHELMHGLGPHTVGKSTVRAALEDTYSAIEEAKADASGLWALQFLVDKGVLPKAMAHTMYVTFLASAFRTIRFGVTEAHGKGQAMQLAFLLDEGAITAGKDGTFAVDDAKIKAAVTRLTTTLLTLEAHGDRDGAQKLLARGLPLRASIQAVLGKLRDVPVDIAPRFVAATALH